MFAVDSRGEVKLVARPSRIVPSLAGFSQLQAEVDSIILCRLTAESDGAKDGSCAKAGSRIALIDADGDALFTNGRRDTQGFSEGLCKGWEKRVGRGSIEATFANFLICRDRF
jgi:hypothetical protein